MATVLRLGDGVACPPFHSAGLVAGLARIQRLAPPWALKNRASIRSEGRVLRLLASVSSSPALSTRSSSQGWALRCTNSRKRRALAWLRGEASLCVATLVCVVNAWRCCTTSACSALHYSPRRSSCPTFASCSPDPPCSLCRGSGPLLLPLGVAGSAAMPRLVGVAPTRILRGVAALRPYCSLRVLPRVEAPPSTPPSHHHTVTAAGLRPPLWLQSLPRCSSHSVGMVVAPAVGLCEGRSLHVRRRWWRGRVARRRALHQCRTPSKRWPPSSPPIPAFPTAPRHRLPPPALVLAAVHLRGQLLPSMAWRG